MVPEVPPGYSWYFNQHAPVYQHDIFIEMLEVIDRFDGKIVSDPTEINDAFLELGVLPPDMRSGRISIWRDYQQAFAEVGAIYSTLVTGRKIIVTEVGKMALAGEVNVSEFFDVQALGYQYPNGHRRTVPGRIRSLFSGTKYEGCQSMPEAYSICGIRIKPFLLIVQTLDKLMQRDPREGVLTTTEIMSFLVPKHDNDGIELLANNILASRNTQKYPDQVGNRRNISDILAFLDKTNIFKKFGERDNYSIRFSSGDEEFIARVRKMILRELSPNSWCDIRSGSDAESMKWFEYYGSAERFEAILEDRILESLIQERNAEYEFYETSQVEPPSLDPFTAEPEAAETPSAPVRYTANRFATADLKEKANRGHKKLVKAIAEILIRNGVTPKENRKSVDLFAEVGHLKYYFEMKTIRRSNIASQIRNGIAKLYEYSYLYERGNRTNIVLVLVLNNKPQQGWIIDYLIKDRGIHPCWTEIGGFEYSEESRKFLDPVFR